MKILIVSDAWQPQTNGVVRTYENLRIHLEALGHIVRVIGPHDFPWRIPMPGYPEIELALFPSRLLAKMIDELRPDTVHIATEGPLGQAAWKLCARRGWPFTTCFHTMFPDYAGKRAGKIAAFLEQPVRRYFIRRLQRFHNAATVLMTATPSLEAILKGWGFTVPMHRVTRGVDTRQFTAQKQALFADRKQPVAIYAGRVAIEKNLEAFLAMDWPGSKIIVGDGPDRASLQRKFPNALFTGTKIGADLVAAYQSADLFVFPSRTDTFGMVIAEALSCGLPVAAYPVAGPADIVTQPMLGSLNNDLATAAGQALRAAGTPEARHAHVAKNYTWPLAARQFADAIAARSAFIPWAKQP